MKPCDDGPFMAGEFALGFPIDDRALNCWGEDLSRLSREFVVSSSSRVRLCVPDCVFWLFNWFMRAAGWVSVMFEFTSS